MASFQDAEDEARKAIADGFEIRAMNMRDAETGEMMWEKHAWPSAWRSEEVEARIPADVMNRAAVSREMTFSSAAAIDDFRLRQRVYLGEHCIEEWDFDFGFVIPGSVNTWQTTIESAGEGAMLDPTQISGLVCIETSFLDGDVVFNKSVVRVYYEQYD